MASRVILLRHTRLADGDGRCYGRTDLPLANTAAQDIAAVIANLPQIDRIVSSPASRCLQLAQAIARQRQLSLSIDARWQELDFGVWEGLQWDQLPRGELDAWAADSWLYRPGGGENAQMLYARVAAAIAEQRDALTSERVLIVTHGGPLRAARVLSERLSFTAHFSLPAPQGEWIQVTFATEASIVTPIAR
jgi:alpha-ribazole phosphatase